MQGCTGMASATGLRQTRSDSFSCKMGSVRDGTYSFILPRAIIAMAAQQTGACVQLSLVTARPREGRACQDAAFHLGSPDTNTDSALE